MLHVYQTNELVSCVNQHQLFSVFKFVIQKLKTKFAIRCLKVKSLTYYL